MCARFEIQSTPDDLLALLEVEANAGAPPLPEKQLNIRPTDAVLIATNEAPRRAQHAFWGFLDSWSEAGPGGQPLRPINARDDKLERGHWRHALEKQRCLIPATSFFEWRTVPDPKLPQRSKPRKQPVKFSLIDHRPFCFAGLWNVYKGKLSCTIITTTPSPLVAPVHDRMPAILPREAMAAWMASGPADLEELRLLLKPYPAELMISEEVDPRDPASLAPPPEDPQLALF